MNPQTKKLKGYKSERCMDCSHAEKISSCRIKCKIDRSIRWKDYTCGSFDYSEECYEQSTEQQEAISGEKTIEDILSSCISGELKKGDFVYEDEAIKAMQIYASQQTAIKDKQLQVQQSHIDDQDQLIFEQDKEITELKEAISELIQVKDWKDKHGKDEHYLKAMPIAWENVRKLIQK